MTVLVWRAVTPEVEIEREVIALDTLNNPESPMVVRPRAFADRSIRRRNRWCSETGCDKLDSSNG
jgi:hypothetical protein